MSRWRRPTAVSHDPEVLMIRWLLTGACLALFAAPAAAYEARLYVTWKAPYGMPGAQENLTVACDGAGEDTLYLSFDPGRASPTMLGISGTVYFHAAEDDTLGRYWQIEDMNVKGSPVRVVFEADSSRGFTTPFLSPGAGQGRYDYVAGSGRLRMIWAVAANAASAVEAGHVYGWARVILKHPAAGQGGCGQPMCVEWHAATLAVGASDVFDANGGPRWASINSPGAKVCGTYRSSYASRTWKPKSGKP
jgi:hypothetical protein